MAELHHDEIAGLDQREDAFPMSAGNVGAAAGAAEGLILDIDFGGVEEAGERMSPAPEAVGADVPTVLDCRIADKEESRQGGIVAGMQDARARRRLGEGHAAGQQKGEKHSGMIP